MTTVNISDAEWQVMQAVWQRGTASAAEVIADLSQLTDWQHRTVRTLLGRLVEKGVLATEAEGNRYLYRPLVDRQTCVRQEARSFAKKVFAGDSAEMLVHFVRHAKINPDQIDELKRLLDAKRGSQR